MNAVKIERKELSNGLAAILVTIGEQQGMLLPELAKVLGVTQSTLKDHCTRHRLLIASPDVDQISDMQQQGVISLKTRRVNFLPRETVEALVKLVNTPEAWTIYGQLWEVARGNALSPLEMVRDFAFMRALIDAAEREKERADKAEEVLNSIMDRPTAAALRLSYKSFQVIRLFPGVQDELRRVSEENAASDNKKKQEWTLEHKTMQAMFGYWLRVCHGYSPEIRWMSKRGDANLYDRVFIDQLMQNLGYEKSIASVSSAVPPAP